MQLRLISFAVLGILACGGNAPREPRENRPKRLIARAIEAAGGEAALKKVTALTWDGEATVVAGGRTVQIAGTWQIQPPDTAIIATYEVAKGPSSTRSIVVATPRGWTIQGGKTTAMTPAMLASERLGAYMYHVMQLVTLIDEDDDDFELSAAASDTAGNRGVIVHREGRPDISVFFDRDARLAHLTAEIPQPDNTKLLQDMWFSGEIVANGVKWPTRINMFNDGKPFFDLTIKKLSVGPRLTDSLLTGPRR